VTSLPELERGPLFAFRALVATHALQPDPAQSLAVEKLQSLWQALRNYQPSAGGVGWKERLGLARRRDDPPQGLYICGPVGTGKSMLMDLFFAAVTLERKRRVHFHAFMQEVHGRLFAWRQASKGEKADPLPEIAEEIAGEAWLLCFDEFHVVNIADAMILQRLFEALFAAGTVVVATSNWPPDRLYEGGLQRERFLPFIALVKEKLDVLQLDGGRDWRRQRLKTLPVYHAPLGPNAERALDEGFAALTAGATAQPTSLTVQGRNLACSAAARGVARFTFDELCARPLGAADYLAIAAAFHTVVLSDVPVLGEQNRNEARRFITLIDALYEAKTKLILSAAAPPDRLYPTGDGAEEFKRTASRLMEMRSAEYLALEHRAQT
jgi:cell division protein ZapE